jgi:hypothetical protein
MDIMGITVIKDVDTQGLRPYRKPPKSHSNLSGTSENYADYKDITIIGNQVSAAKSVHEFHLIINSSRSTTFSER